jgi:hypothetical protein
MRTYTKFILLSPVAVVIAGGLLFVGGVLSTPRDFSSPPTRIRVIDQRDTPMSGIEVSRDWYDSDSLKNGSDVIETDQTGTSQFSKIPASVGLFTGAWRKTYTRLLTGGSGSGTHTTIYVRYHGLYNVVPKWKTLHPAGMTSQDQDGVWFYSGVDDQSNTLVEIKFPDNTKTIDYELLSKSHDK